LVVEQAWETRPKSKLTTGEVYASDAMKPTSNKATRILQELRAYKSWWKEVSELLMNAQSVDIESGERSIA
jgi:hypothetical protein